ncbi:MAG: flagellar protein FlaG [Sphingomonadales bacterium]
MEGGSQKPQVAPGATAVAQQGLEPSRGKAANSGGDPVATELPEDQSVQATGKSEKEESVKTSALARVEKALSEAFGEGFANLRIEVEKDEPSGRFVYKAVNKVSGEVERQFPSEEMLRIFSSIEGRDGNFLDDTA